MHTSNIMHSMWHGIEHVTHKYRTSWTSHVTAHLWPFLLSDITYAHCFLISLTQDMYKLQSNLRGDQDASIQLFSGCNSISVAWDPGCYSGKLWNLGLIGASDGRNIATNLIPKVFKYLM